MSKASNISKSLPESAPSQPSDESGAVAGSPETGKLKGKKGAEGKKAEGKGKAAKKRSPKKKAAAKKRASQGAAPSKGSKGWKPGKGGTENGIEIGDETRLREESARLEGLSPRDRILWALETFPGRIAMSSSFGAQSAVSLHMITREFPDIPVILIDTGYLFPETYQFIEELTERLNLNLRVFSNPMTPAFQEARFGQLWENGIEGIEQYNLMNKVEPMNRALAELDVDALFSGLRRQQSLSRQKMPVVVSQRGRIKVHPIVDWTDRDVGRYLTEHDLPYHPLWDEGYVSIGDHHTSRRLADGMTEEETRFFGLKRECGLHEDVDFQI